MPTCIRLSRRPDNPDLICSTSGVTVTLTCDGPHLVIPYIASQEGTTKDQMVDAGIDRQEATATIADTLEREPQLSGVLEMFRKLNMQGLLIGPEIVTFFAPRSIDALAGKSDEDLGVILRRHILGRAVTLDELRTATA